MAMTQSQAGAGRIGGSARWSAVYAAGMLAIFAGERIIGTGKPRMVATVLGLVLVLAAMAVRMIRSGRAPADRRQVERTLLGLYALGLVSVLVYFVQSDVPTLRGGKPLEHSWPRLATALRALWPALWIAAGWPIALVELAYANMARAPHLEVRRIRDALLSGLGIAFALIFAFSVAWVTSERDKKVDLAYFRTTRPGESTRKIVRSLDQPTEVVTFFPAGNEVREEVANYFTDLAKESSQLQFKQYDYDIDPTKAHEYTVTTNGTVVVARAARKEMIQIPVQLESARSALKTLDKEVQQRLLEVVKPKRVVLFTQGHNERWFEKGPTENERPGLRDLREVMRDQGHEVRSFGAADGLMTDVPKEATLVMIVGPQKPFEAEEIGTLSRYLDRGGRIFVALDPDGGVDLADLLGPLGVKFHASMLANEQAFARRTHQDSDHVNIVTAGFSSHPTMSTLVRLGSRAPLILPGAGWLETTKTKATPSGVTLDTPLRSQPGTFEDKNGNFKHDPGEDQRAFDLAVAITKGSGRMFVVADSDFISDAVIRVGGNGLLALDTVRWLIGDEAFTGQTNTETDVPITHTRKQDVAWFYSSIFLMPAVVVGLGLIVTRRRRRQKPAAAVKSSPNQGVAS
jgi:hypothetical protein